MKYIRRRLGNIEVPTVTFYNEETEKTVVFYSTVHVAHRYFWDTARLDLVLYTLRRYLVYSEGLNLPEHPTNLSEKEQEAIKNLGASLSSSKELAKILGMQHQSDALYLYNKTFLNADISMVDLIHLLTPEELKEFTAIKASHITDLIDVFGKRLGPRVLLFLFKWALTGAHKSTPNARSNGVKADRIIIDHRNRELVKKVLDNNEDKSLLVWGAGHGPGVEALLLEQGFKTTDVTWRTVVYSWQKIPKVA